MLTTTSRTNVIEIVYIPTGWSSPEQVRIPREEFSSDAGYAIDEAVEYGYTLGEPIEISTIGDVWWDGRVVWSNSRY